MTTTFIEFNGSLVCQIEGRDIVAVFLAGFFQTFFRCLQRVVNRLRAARDVFPVEFLDAIDLGQVLGHPDRELIDVVLPGVLFVEDLLEEFN